MRCVLGLGSLFGALQVAKSRVESLRVACGMTRVEACHPKGALEKVGQRRDHRRHVVSVVRTT